MQGCFKCSISPDETPIIVRASCPTAACSRDNSALVEYLTSYCSYTLYSIIYVTFLIVFVGHTLRNSFCKTSLMTDRLCPNWPHEQGGGIFICKTLQTLHTMYTRKDKLLAEIYSFFVYSRCS